MLYGGVPIYRSLMLELSYVQLGQFPSSIKTTSADVAALAQRILGQLAPAGHGVTAGFALPLEFGSLFGIEPRPSALYYQSKQVVEGGTATTVMICAAWGSMQVCPRRFVLLRRCTSASARIACT
jgi:hypothetical protein